MDNKKISNTELVNRCLRGDSFAWQTIVDRYARLVHSVPVRYGLSQAEVDDIGQDVFLALAQNLHQIEHPERLSSWLVTTARRISWRVIKQGQREQLPADAELSDSPMAHEGNPLIQSTPSIDELFASWGRQELMYEALNRLNERCRTLLYLLFLDPQELSYEDVSERLEMPMGSIGPTRNRCLQQLRSILQGLGFKNLHD